MSIKILTLSFAFIFLQACGEDLESVVDERPSTANERPISTGVEIPALEVCDEEYSMCGHLSLPDSLAGQPRELLIALFSSLPPQGPPDAVLMRVDTPSLGKGEFYPIRVQPVLESGEYYIYVSLYMEGGGEYQPMAGVDYVGATPAKLDFDGGLLKFDDIEMKMAE
jgi:hypothetical protein